jgi:hypothetical protein
MPVAPEVQASLRRLYDAFNRKDLDTVLSAASPDVDWPNLLIRRRVTGTGDIREFWDRQFRAIDPQLEVLAVSEGDNGTVVARVHQVVTFVSDGAVIEDVVVDHIFTFGDDGRVVAVDARGADGNLVLPSEHVAGAGIDELTA